MGHHQYEDRRQSVDPAAQQLVEELGVLGWRCKSAPRPRWPPDATASAGVLASALMPYVSELPSSDLAHCCWALAQLGEVAGGDAAVAAFVGTVQRELLTPVLAPQDATSPDLRNAPKPGTAADSHLDFFELLTPERDPVPTHGAEVEAQAEPSRQCSRLSVLVPKDMSKIAWSIAKLGFGSVSGLQGDAAAAAAAAAAASTATPALSSEGDGRRRPTKAAAAYRSRGEAGSSSSSSNDSRNSSTWAFVQQQQQQRLWWRELGNAAADAIDRLEMPPQAMCNTLWAFATAGHRHPALLTAAAECIAEGRRTRYEPVGIANLLWAFSTLRFHSWYKKMARGVGRDGGGGTQHEESPPGGSGRDEGFSSASEDEHEYDKEAAMDEQRQQQQQAHRRQPQQQYQQQQRDGPGDLCDKLYGMLAGLAWRHVSAMSMQQLANTAWALVAAGQHRRQPAARRLLAAICVRATEVAGAAAVAAATAAAAAAAPFGLDDDPEMRVGQQPDGEAGWREVVRQQPYGLDVLRHDPHATSLLAWALSSAARPGQPRCAAYLDAAVAAALAVPPGLASYCDQDLAMLLGAHGRTRHYSPPLVRAVRQEVLQRAAGMQPQALTDICYSLATSNYYNDELYEAVAAAAGPQLEQFGPSLASRLVWSLARARHYSPQLLDAFSEYIRPRLAACSPPDLVASAASLAQFHHYDPLLFQGLSREVLTRTAPSAAAGSAAATSAAPSAATSAAPSAVPQLPPRALVNLLWCCAVLSHVDEAMLGALLGRLRQLDINRLGVPAVMQLFQAQVMLQDLYGGVIKPPEVFTAEQMQIARATWQRVTRGATTTSRMQEDVVACLRRLGCSPSCERVTLDGLFSIDTSLEWEGRRVAVEVDGPSHFTCSRPLRPLGRTLAKRRCLEMRGWRVLSVPGHEWRALGGSPATEERYMRAALDGVLWRTHVLEGLK